MGINGLLPFLKDASRKCYINEFRGCTVAIDSYCWLHKGAFACAEKLVRGENTSIYIQYCLKYIQLLVSCNIKPIMVFDGQHLPAKKATELKRREQRKTARARGTELLQLGKIDEARTYFRQCVDITHEMALALIKECRSRGIDCIVAPYEADAQLAYLNMQGIADIIITEDSDLVLFGCEKILFKFNLDGSAVLVEKSKLNVAMKMQPDEFTFDKFRYMCIMSGCDYLDSLPGIGLKKSHKAVVMTHDPDIYRLLQRLPRYLNMKKLTVSEEYMENFKYADATVKHQVVYDPIKRILVRLTNPEDSAISVDYLKNAGEIYDGEKAYKMALGNIDPIRLTVMDNWDPDDASVSVPSTSIWSNKYTKSVVKIATKQHKKVSPKHISAVQEKPMVDYDQKLSEELKMYQNIEPSPKRSKPNEVTQDTISSLLVDEPQVHNPFIKNTQLKKLSKFGITNVSDNELIRSRFFTTHIKETVHKESTTTLIESNGSEDLVYSSNQIGSEGDEQIDNEIKDEPVNWKTFAFKKSTKRMCTTNNTNELCTEKDLEVDMKIDIQGLSNNENDFIISNNGNSEHEDDRASPVLSSSCKWKWNGSDYFSQTSTTSEGSLEAFKLNKSKKKIGSLKNGVHINGKVALAIDNIVITDDSNYESQDDQLRMIESDAENLTPEEPEEVRPNNTIADNFRASMITLSGNNNLLENKFVANALSESSNSNVGQVSSHSKNITIKEKITRSTSCRSVGLSRNRRKSGNQPTLLSIFNKMLSKD